VFRDGEVLMLVACRRCYPIRSGTVPNHPQKTSTDGAAQPIGSALLSAAVFFSWVMKFHAAVTMETAEWHDHLTSNCLVGSYVFLDSLVILLLSLQS